MKQLAHEASLGLAFLRDERIILTTNYILVVYDVMELEIFGLLIYLNIVYTKRLTFIFFFVRFAHGPCTQRMHVSH
jgi:hypothetical protein